jgi:hypothetical protein
MSFPPIYLPLHVRRSGFHRPHQVVLDFRLPVRYYHVPFSLVVVFHTKSPQKSKQKQCSLIIFPLSYTLWAFANLIFRLVLLSSCPSQSHIAGLCRALNLVWVFHLDINSFCIMSSHLVQNCHCLVQYFDHISLIWTRILVLSAKLTKLYTTFIFWRFAEKIILVVISLIDQNLF